MQNYQKEIKAWNKIADILHVAYLQPFYSMTVL